MSTYSLKNVARTDRFLHIIVRRSGETIDTSTAVYWGSDVSYGYLRSGRLYEHLRHHSSRFRHVHGCFCCFHRKGATLHKPKFSEALRTGLIFGAIETLTPLIGWGLGMLASQFVLEWNHWIAFVLLVFSADEW